MSAEQYGVPKEGFDRIDYIDLQVEAVDKGGAVAGGLRRNDHGNEGEYGYGYDDSSVLVSDGQFICVEWCVLQTYLLT